MNIRQIQHLLAYLGYDPGPVDGLDGLRTRAAVTAFQQAFSGLEATGEANEDTRKALRHAVAYGLPEPESEEIATPSCGTVCSDQEGTFWEEIEYFGKSEFACKCGLYHAPYCDGWPAEMQEAVVRLCDDARRHFGRPGHIVSGLRCPRHNADSGGVANSQHMYGEAVDLMIEGVSADSLLSYIQSRPGVRYAYKINETNVHFDIPKGER